MILGITVFKIFIWGCIPAHMCDAFCDFGACGGTTSSAENVTFNDVDKFYWRRTLFCKRTLATFNNKQTFLPLQK